jgi:hypothetical protein
MEKAKHKSKTDYDRVSITENWKLRILYLSTAITLALTLNEKYKYTEINPGLKDYLPVIIGFNSMIVILYIYLDIRANFIYSKAEQTRIYQYIDNSFDTNFAGIKTKGYFTQDKLNIGFYKFCVNCFESTFFSYNIAKKMQSSAYAKAILVFLIFVFSATVGDKGTVRYLTEAILPLALIQSAIRLSVFTARLDDLKDTFASFFTSIKNSNFTDREPEAIKNVIRYETTLAWASISLDSDIYNEMNENLSAEWEEMKIQFLIK